MELNLEYEAFFATPEGREFLENERRWHSTVSPEWTIEDAALLERIVRRFGDEIVFYVKYRLKKEDEQ